MQSYLKGLSQEGIAALRTASSSREVEKMDVQHSWEH